jgi:hypothetical protein
MSKQNNPGLHSAIILGFALSLTACDSAMITGSGGPAIGAAMAAPELLQDGDFEVGATAWESCSTNGSSELVRDSGSMALQISNGACRYQNINADAGTSYTLTCDAKKAADGWSSVTLAFLDQNFRPLDSREVEVTSDSYSDTEITMTAPDFTSKVEVLFYSEDTMTVDNCALAEVAVEVPPVELQNGTFNDGLNGWSQCSGTDAIANSGVATLATGACINQQVDVTEAVAASPVNTPLTLSLQCDQINKSGNQFATAVIAYLDENNEPVATAEQAISATTTATAVRLSAPASATTAEVMLYSEAQTTVGQCALVTIN